MSRNKLFLNVDGNQFEDVSIVSGTDSVADGRGFAIWDYDHDGAQDIALINLNSPQLQIFHNGNVGSNENGYVAVRLVGGNATADPSSEWSNRNGIGAKVFVAVGEKTILRELRCGEGMGNQNSSTLIIGFGSSDIADSVSVHWPSGKSQVVSEVAAGSLLTFFENPNMAPDSKPCQVSSYESVRPSPAKQVVSGRGPFAYNVSACNADDADLRVLITMATWCAACQEHLPEITRLERELEGSKVSFYGIPVDNKDTPEKLGEYANHHKVPYRILDELEIQNREQTSAYIKSALGADTLPCTVISDRNGHPLSVHAGIPTISDIRRLLANTKP